MYNAKRLKKLKIYLTMVKNVFLVIALILSSILMKAQDVMTPETLWKVKRLSVLGTDKAQNNIYFKLKIPNVAENNFDSKFYKMPILGGAIVEIDEDDVKAVDKNISPDGKFKLYHDKVLLQAVKGSDAYKDLAQSDVYIYNDLDIRHWDAWQDGQYNHVFYKEVNNEDENGIDIMIEEPFHTPQKPFGGDEDYLWSPDGSAIYYVSKKLQGKAYVTSTNTDIYKYDLQSKTTKNITKDNPGYDTNPAFSKQGALAWLQMKTAGNESDKNDIVVLQNGVKQNLTAQWDGSVRSFFWDENGKDIYFVAPIDGTIQLFRVNYPGKSRIAPVVQQISEGQFDVTSIIAKKGETLIVTRNDMNHAADIYSFNLKNHKFKQLTQVNKDLYNHLELPTVTKRYVTTTDDKQMLVWVILPPNFDPNKKYPTLLYAQGGPQSPLSQFYSYRWNFSLMASQGYIIVAPNRRGMPGHGVDWNAEISKDWGGQVMQDYLSAIDDMAKEPYVDKDRLGAIGASFGGYSVFYLAGIHDKRFKTFIAHDGVFDTRTMAGTTEELFFLINEFGGMYWEDNADTNKAYNEFNPINMVAKWDTPIMIVQGGKDYRVPIEQGLSAFQAAQMLGIKSKLVYFPEENHWVLNPQNALIWQSEFFKWLEETL